MSFHKLTFLILLITGNITVISVLAYYLTSELYYTHLFKVGIAANIILCIFYLLPKKITILKFYGLFPILIFLYSNFLTLVNIYYFDETRELSPFLFHNLLPINILIGYMVSQSVRNREVNIAFAFINNKSNFIFINILILSLSYFILYINGTVIYWGVFSVFGVFGVYYLLNSKNKYHKITLLLLLLFGKRSILIGQFFSILMNGYQILKKNKLAIIFGIPLIYYLINTFQIFQRFEYVQTSNLFDSLDYYSSGRLSEIYYNLIALQENSYRLLLGAGNGFKLITLYIKDGFITEYSSASVHMGALVYVYNYGIVIGSLIYISNIYCLVISLNKKNKYQFFSLYYQYIFIAGHFGNLYYIDTLYWISFFIILNKKNYKSN